MTLWVQEVSPTLGGGGKPIPGLTVVLKVSLGVGDGLGDAVELVWVLG